MIEHSATTSFMTDGMEHDVLRASRAEESNRAVPTTSTRWLLDTVFPGASRVTLPTAVLLTAPRVTASRVTRLIVAQLRVTPVTPVVRTAAWPTYPPW